MCLVAPIWPHNSYIVISITKHSNSKHVTHTHTHTNKRKVDALTPVFPGTKVCEHAACPG